MRTSRLREPRRCRLEILEPRTVMAAAPVLESVTRIASADFQYNFRLVGVAEPLSEVAIEQTGRGVVGSALADEIGRWTLDVNNAQLGDSKFEFRATALDSPSEVSVLSAALVHRPNIVLINVDDMRAEQVRFMPYLTRLSATGTVFNNFVAPTSVSGPSRASLLTGLLALHNGVLNNSSTLGTHLNFDDSSTLPVWLSAAGYQTGLFGKDRTQPNVERRYQSQDIFATPPGWDNYFAGISNGTSGYDAAFTDNGTLFSLTGDQYVTDVLRDKLLNFTNSSASEPFFAYLAPYAPHAPGTPAVRHANAYDGLLPPRGPNYLAPDLPSLNPEHLELWEAYYRQGAESLLAVDEAIAAITQSLAARRQLDNTVIIFTADNGYLYGEHNGLQKNLFWEESIRVPLIIWDGRNRVGQVASGLAATVDITATIADLSGAARPAQLDGVSLARVLSNPTIRARDSILLEHLATNDSGILAVDHSRLGVRTQNWVYERSTEGDRHMYDLSNDPYQLNNLIARPEYAPQAKQLDRLLEQWLGSDRQPPRLAITGLRPTGQDYTTPQSIRLTVDVNDRGTGNSQIRTPSVFFSNKSFALGRALEPVDGKFDSSRELAYADLSFPELTESGLPISLLTAGRDLPGNVSSPIPVPLTFDPEPQLRPADDTGDSNSDRVTLKSTPTFIGRAEPGERIALFSIASRQGVAELLGTATVDARGAWSIAASFAQPGYYVIYGQKATAVGAPIPKLSFLKPTSFHLLASVSDNLATVAGSPWNDRILVEPASLGASSWKYSLNGTVVGALPAAASVSIIGDDGNDWLEIRGKIQSRLNGGNGDDVLIGGEGNDVLLGWRGANELRGGRGDDRYLFSFGEQQIRRNFAEPMLLDTVFEEVGAGTDRLDFSGEFAVTANLGADEVEPYLRLSPRLGLSGKIRISDPTAIERLVGSDSSGSWTIPSNILVFGGAGDDAVQLADAIAPGDEVELHSLTLGEDAFNGEEMRFKLIASGGTLRFTRSLPRSMGLVFQSTNHLELVGSLESFNAFMIGDGIRLASSDTQRGRAFVTLRAYPLSDPTHVQRGSVSASVLSLTGVTDGTYNLLGPPLRFAPAARLVADASSVAGGVLVVSLLGTGRAGDRLRVLSRPPGATSITLQDGNVLYGGLTMGKLIAAGQDGGDLRVALASTAPLDGVQALVRSLAYERISSPPREGARRLEVLLTDRWGGNSRARLTIAGVFLNNTPILDFGSNDPIPYRLGSKAFVNIGSSGIIREGDGIFAGESLTIGPSGFTEPTDRMRISPQGNGLDHVNVEGTFILASGIAVGIETSPVDKGSLTITWTATATARDIQLVLRRVQVRTLARSLNPLSRLFGLAWVDGLGRPSVEALRWVEFISPL